MCVRCHCFCVHSSSVSNEWGVHSPPCWTPRPGDLNPSSLSTTSHPRTQPRSKHSAFSTWKTPPKTPHTSLFVEKAQHKGRAGRHKCRFTERHKEQHPKGAPSHTAGPSALPPCTLHTRPPPHLVGHPSVHYTTMSTCFNIPLGYLLPQQRFVSRELIMARIWLT